MNGDSKVMQSLQEFNVMFGQLDQIDGEGGSAVLAFVAFIGHAMIECSIANYVCSAFIFQLL